MCLSPYSFPNPNYRSKNPYIVAFKDTTSQMINVPCGHCPQCIAVKQMGLVQRIQMESFDNHLFFTTLTYSNQFLPCFTCSNGRRIPFSDFVDIDMLLKRIRNDNAFTRPFKYVCVSERGGKNHRPHFHLIWIVRKYDSDDFDTCLNLERIIRDSVLSRWCRNFGTRGHPDYRPITNFCSRWYAGKLHTNYDTHYVNPSLTTNGVSDAAFYVLKYMLKANPYERYLYASLKSELDSADFAETFGIVKSRCTMSKGVGNCHSLRVVNYINDCIARSDVSLGYPQYFSPESGQRFPLCQYYRKRFLDVSKGYDFAYNFEENVGLNGWQKVFRWSEFEKCLKRVNEHESQVFYDLLD